MKKTVDCFVELGERLARFGSTAPTQEIIRRAVARNGWFSPEEILHAVAAIREEMLCRPLLEAWLSPYDLPVTTPRRVLVILAGNIPLVGFFDLLCVAVSGHEALVKPSGKDSVLIEYLLDELRAIEPSLPLTRYDGSIPPDAVIATGSDNTNRYFRARYGTLPALLRGSRQSAAVLTGDESDEALRGLQEDIFAYSGLGCRSVSRLFLPRGYRLRLTPPRMNPKYRNNYLQIRALLTLRGVPFLDFGEALAVEEEEFPTAVSQINYTYYDSAEEVRRWLIRHDARLQCVVANAADFPRSIPFGRAQHPALTDYPDDRDVLRFLAGLQ